MLLSPPSSSSELVKGWYRSLIQLAARYIWRRCRRICSPFLQQCSMENKGRAWPIWTSVERSKSCRGRRWCFWRRPLEICLPTSEIRLVFRSHLFWWLVFASPWMSSLPACWGLGWMWRQIPCTPAKRWSLATFNDYTACWFS